MVFAHFGHKPLFCFLVDLFRKVDSENTIFSGPDTKLFHFCMVEQNTLATFVNSSKMLRLKMDCTGSEFAVYFEKAHPRNAGKK